MEKDEIKGLNFSSTGSRSELNSSASEEATRDAFMKEAETYLTFAIAEYLNKYWFPILVPIGLVGNTLSFLVMIKPNNRKVSTCIYMAAISVNDNVMMCLVIHQWLIGTRIHRLKSLECHVTAYLVSVTLQNASFQVLAMTVDRYIAIKWPHKAAVYNTPKRALISITVIYICVIIFNLPNIFFSKLIGNECIGYVTGGIVAKVHAWFSLTLNALIPFSLLIYMNSVIVHQV